MIQINDLTYRIGPRLLFDAASASLPAGAKAGLVGRNGAGKTTLFRLITGELTPESGGVSLPRAARIGQVAQEAPSTDQSLIDVVLAADTERKALLEEAEHAVDPHRIAEIQLRLADIDAHAAEARAASILSGLGFGSETQRGPCSALSGGWRMRVALAAVLFSEPDLLLLDEPTNYLDLEGTLWLQNYLARYRHTVIVISHDRDLLDTAVDTIVHLDQAKLVAYRGGYSQFDRQRREKQALQIKLRRKQDEQRRHLESFVERFRAKATKARQAQSRLKALAKLQPVTEIVDDHVQPIVFPDPARPASPPIVAMEGASVGYAPGAPVLSRLNLRIDDDDRIGLLGQNGNGKSTFAKLVAGRLDPLAGTVRRAKLTVAYFAQHQLDELDPRRSAYDHLRALLPDQPEAKVRARAGAIGFPGGKADTPAGELSGGERARLLLGLATFDGPNLVILDEPTNHLDIDSREALVMALNDYAGAVMIISHDRHLLEATVDRLWLVADGTVSRFDGDIDDYRRQVLDSRSERAPAEARATGADRRREAAQKREEQAPLRRKVKDAEKRIADLQKRLERLDAVLAAPETYAGDPAAPARHARERSELARALATAEDEWLDLSQRLEEAAGP